VSIYRDVSKLNKAINTLERTATKPVCRMEFWEAVQYGELHRIFAGGETTVVCITPISLPAPIIVSRIKMIAVGNGSNFNCALYRLVATRESPIEQTWRRITEGTERRETGDNEVPMQFDLRLSVDLDPRQGQFAVAWYTTSDNAEYRVHHGSSAWYPSFETAIPAGTFPDVLHATGPVRRTPSIYLFSDLGVRAAGG
jgi:hypothetical protein